MCFAVAGPILPSAVQQCIWSNVAPRLSNLTPLLSSLQRLWHTAGHWCTRIMTELYPVGVSSQHMQWDGGNVLTDTRLIHLYLAADDLIFFLKKGESGASLLQNNIYARFIRQGCVGCRSRSRSFPFYSFLTGNSATEVINTGQGSATGHRCRLCCSVFWFQ